MTALSDRRSTLILIPALAMSAVASARSLEAGDEDDKMTLAVLALRDDGKPSHTNFGPYDVELDGVSDDGFHFDLQVADENVWIASCAIGDGTRLLCSFYAPDTDTHAFLAVDERQAGLDSGALLGPDLLVSVRDDLGGWTLVDDDTEVAGVKLLGRDRVWFDRRTDLGKRSLLAAAAGALLVFDELRL